MSLKVETSLEDLIQTTTEVTVMGVVKVEATDTVPSKTTAKAFSLELAIVVSGLRLNRLATKMMNSLSA